MALIGLALDQNRVGDADGGQRDRRFLYPG
jgi:hypothetical protein